MICINSNNSVRNNQAFLQESFNVYYALGGVLPASYESDDVLQRFSKYTIALFKELVRRHMFQDHVFPSHIYLSKKLKCNTRTIQRAQKELEDHGLIEVTSGKKRHQTNLYSLGKILYDSNSFYYLRDVVPSLRFVIRRLKGYLGLDTVENQNVVRINNVLKVFNTNTNTIVENKTKEPKKYNHFQQAKYELQADRWKKESEEQILREEQAVKDAASKRWRDAVAESRNEFPVVLRTKQDIAKIQSTLHNAATTMTGGALSFLKYLL